MKLSKVTVALLRAILKRLDCVTVAYVDEAGHGRQMVVTRDNLPEIEVAEELPLTPRTPNGSR